MTARIRCGRWLQVFCGVALVWAGLPGLAQQASSDAEDLGPASIDIDLDRLLFETQNTTQDPVWRLQAEAGKRIVLLPFTVTSVDRVNKLSRFPISARTGRFIGFVIPKPDQAGQTAGRVDLNRIVNAAPDALQALLFEEPLQPEREAHPADPQAAADRLVPENAPRLAREILLHPDGTVQWSMDRSFHAAELQAAGDQNLYAYKIDAEQLRAAQPERAERLVRNDGEDSRAFAERKRQQQLEDRDKQEAYRTLRDKLRDLPETFREPMPGVLYAAIEVSDQDALLLQGPAPYPWTLDTEKKQLLDQLARGGNAFQDAQGEDLAGKLVTMIQAHALDARAVAIATTRGSLAGQVKTDDPGYEILSRLLRSEDIPTRRIALYGVAKTTPPTLASARLIGVAGEAVLGEERKMLSFASLSKLFSTQEDDPDSARALIDRVSQTIADPQGPSAPRIIQQVLDSLGQDAGYSKTTLSEPTLDAMISAIDLSAVTADEIDGVASAIILSAPNNPVAAGWLDQKLLGSEKQSFVDRTLALLAETTVKRSADSETSGLDTDDEPDTPIDPSDKQPSLVLSRTIGMTSKDHALLALLTSEQAAHRDSAWAVLGRFHLALPESGGEGVVVDGTADADPQAIDPSLELFDAVLAQATALTQVPMGVIDFITSQQDATLRQVADDRLIALIASDRLAGAALKHAVSQVLGKPQDYGQAIGALDSAARLALVEAMYASMDEQPPLMAGLIADAGQTLSWWTSRMAETGRLPGEEEWAQLATERGESALLQSASSTDAVVASAAAAGLVLQAGGDESQQQGFAQVVALMQARTSELVQEQWTQQRGKIFAAAYKRAEGTYQMVVTLRGADAGEALGVEGSQPAEADAAQRIDLGLVQLRAEGLTLSLSVEAVVLSATPNQLGIRIDSPATLRAFNKPDLANLALDQLNQPIDLLPEAGGLWAGQVTLPSGKVLVVSLEPAN